MRLDRHRRAAGERHALDDVRIERALRQELGPAQLLGLLLEHLDKKRTDGLALGLGVALAGQRGKEAFACVDVDERDVEVTAEERYDLLGLVLSQQSMVHKDAGELRTNGFMDEYGRDRTVDTAREAADDAPFADLGADFGDLARPEVGHAPVARQASDAAHEVGDDLAAFGRVRHLGVELHGIELAPFVSDGGERCPFRYSHDLEAWWQPRYAVAVAHPHRIALALGPHILEEQRIARHLELRAAELSVVPAFHATTQLRHHRLLAIADAEHGQAGGEDPVRRPRGSELGDAGGSAGEDHRPRAQTLQRVLGAVERHDLRVDTLLAHTPGDQLRHLAAEIDDEDGICVRLWGGDDHMAALLGRRRPAGESLHRRGPIDHCDRGRSRRRAGSSTRSRRSAWAPSSETSNVPPR